MAINNDIIEILLEYVLKRKSKGMRYCQNYSVRSVKMYTLLSSIS